MKAEYIPVVPATSATQKQDQLKCRDCLVDIIADSKKYTVSLALSMNSRLLLGQIVSAQMYQNNLPYQNLNVLEVAPNMYVHHSIQTYGLAWEEP